jgi:hypothetical protein
MKRREVKLFYYWRKQLYISPNLHWKLKILKTKLIRPISKWKKKQIIFLPNNRKRAGIFLNFSLVALYSLYKLTKSYIQAYSILPNDLIGKIIFIYYYYYYYYYFIYLLSFSFVIFIIITDIWDLWSYVFGLDFISSLPQFIWD